MTVAECGGGGEEEVALGSSLFAKGPLQGPSRSAEAGLSSGRAGLDPCGGEGLSLMMEVGWEGWGVDWDGRVDVAPPRCQASCRRAESSLRTPGARSLIIIHVPEGFRAISRWLRSNATTPPVNRLT